MATSKKYIDINIRTALNAAGISATDEQFKKMSASVRESLRKMEEASAASGKRASGSLVKSFTDIKSVAEVALGAVSRAWNALKYTLSESFRFETQMVQFKMLVGSIDEAKAHMADLKALGDTPPFSLDEFARASRSLLVMSDGALGYKKSLELIGDAAAATGVPLESLSASVGQLYAMVRDGQPIGRAANQLRRVGVLSPEVVARLGEMQKAGASGVNIWNEITAALGRFSGAMSETEQTGTGLVGAIQSRWTNMVRAFGDAFANDAKGGLSSVLEAMKDLEEDGTLELWAEKANDSFHSVADGASECASAVRSVFGYVWKSIKGTFEMVAQSGGSAVGALMAGGSIKDALAAAGEGAKAGLNDAWDLDEAQADYDRDRKEQIKAAREKRKADAQAAHDAKVAAEDERVANQLREADEKRRAKEAADADKAANKLADKLADANATDPKQTLAEASASLAALQKAAEDAIAAVRDATGKDVAESAQDAAEKAIAAYAKQKREVERMAKEAESAAKKRAERLAKFDADQAKKAEDRKFEDAQDAEREITRQRIARIDGEIAQAEKDARKWDERRGGAVAANGFGDWQNAQRDANREAAREEKRNANKARATAEEIARLSKRENLKSFTASDRKRLKELREFQELLNGENPAKKRADALKAQQERLRRDQEERERKAREKKQATDIAAMRKALEDGITP